MSFFSALYFKGKVVFWAFKLADFKEICVTREIHVHNPYFIATALLLYTLRKELMAD